MPLGKGLSALISDDAINRLSQGYVSELPIDEISPNPYQPRSEIKPETLVELADSIRKHGIIQPLIVTKTVDNKYQIVVGERRWRAAKMAKLSSVPVIVQEKSAQQMLEIAIIENIQRRDLNPLEEAFAFSQLEKSFKLSLDEIAEKMSMSRPYISNKIRLLQLPKEMQDLLLENKISEGHARALLGLNSPSAMSAVASVAMRDGLSVRAIEELVRRLNQTDKEIPKRSAPKPDEETLKYEKSLRKRFGKGVQLVKSKKGGRIVIRFGDDDEFNRIYKLLTVY